MTDNEQLLLGRVQQYSNKTQAAVKSLSGLVVRDVSRLEGCFLQRWAHITSGCSHKPADSKLHMNTCVNVWSRGWWRWRAKKNMNLKLRMILAPIITSTRYADDAVFYIRSLASGNQAGSSTEGVFHRDHCSYLHYLTLICENPALKGTTS